MIELFKMNAMKVYTCFNSISVHGYSIQILKSGICKYCRRSNNDKLKWCIMEMALFNNHPKGKGLITNLINRLKILLMEDISFEEVDRIYNCIQLIDNYQLNRDNYNLLIEFCDILEYSKKNRLTSYVNCWWRNHSISINNNIAIDRSNKFYKKDDIFKLSILCEHLIQYIESSNEEMFGIFHELCKITDKCGIRYKRRKAVYLWFEVIETYITNDKIKAIFNFSLEMFHRKTMKERYAFGIWIGLYVYYNNRLNTTGNVYKHSIQYQDYYNNHNRIIIDDYVINDLHVNKSFTMENFARNGAFVENEDYSIMNNGEKYKQYYITDKINADKKTKCNKPR